MLVGCVVGDPWLGPIYIFPRLKSHKNVSVARLFDMRSATYCRSLPLIRLPTKPEELMRHTRQLASYVTSNHKTTLPETSLS